MKILNSNINDINEIFRLYKMATDFQKTRFVVHWPECKFCYLANGMNTKDMLFLKYKNIDGEYLTFERAKTERSSRANPILITAYVSPRLQQIIDKWAIQINPPTVTYFL